MQKVYVIFTISMDDPHEGNINFWSSGICDSIETAKLFISKNRYRDNRIYIGRRIDIDPEFDEECGLFMPLEYDWVIEETTIIDTAQIIMNELTK